MDQKRPTRKTPTDTNDETDAREGTGTSGAKSQSQEADGQDDAMAASREEHAEIRKAIETATTSGAQAGGEQAGAPNDRAWDRIAALCLRHFNIEDSTLLEHLGERDETREAAFRFRLIHDLARVLIANLHDTGQPREAIRAKRSVLAWLLKGMFELEEDETQGLAALLKSSGLEEGDLADEVADRRRDEARRNRQRPRLSVLKLDRLERGGDDRPERGGGDRFERSGGDRFERSGGDPFERSGDRLRDDDRTRLAWDDEWRRSDVTTSEGRTADLRRRDRDLSGDMRRMPRGYDEDDDRGVRPGWQQPDWDDDDDRRGSVYGRLMDAPDDERPLYDDDRFGRSGRDFGENIRRDRDERYSEFDRPRGGERGPMRGMGRPYDDRDRFRDDDDRQPMRRR